MNDWMIEWLSDWMIEWLNDWMIEWLNGWMVEWLKPIRWVGKKKVLECVYHFLFLSVVDKDLYVCISMMFLFIGIL